ncbi:MAG: NAD(P)-dependent oxidoreductase [Luminiphilus sp.]
MQRVKRGLSDMRWVVDDGISVTPALKQLMGETRLVAGRDITPSVLADAEVLLVRSITEVDAALLEGSAVRFVGSATAGIDHIDGAALSRLGVGWSAAPGSNAIAVVEYVLSAIAVSGFLEPALNGLGVGIVGLGEVGYRLAGRLSRLGCSVMAFDPLRRRWPDEITQASLEEVLAQPIVSLHASLHSQTPFASRGLLDERHAHRVVAAAEKLGSGLFINAARGDLVTPEALARLLASPLTVVLDTWPGEPVLPKALLAAANWVSPHIAGHSVDAKERGSDMLARALAHWAGGSGEDKPATFSGEVTPVVTPIEDPGGSSDALDWATSFLKKQGTLEREDARVRASSSDGLIAQDFDILRKTYQQPSEWSGRTIRIGSGSEELRTMARRLGMSVVE